MEEDLKKLGLTWNEIKVYLSLLKIGETSVGGILADLKIHRQIAYNALSGLESRNMVVKIKKNKIYHFKINDPKVIVENLQKQEMIAERLSKNIIEDLKKKKREHEISVFDGRTQIRKNFLNSYKSISSNSTIYVISNYAVKLKEVLGEEFLIEQYHKIREKKKIFSKNIAGESFRSDFDKLNKNVKNIRETKFLPDNFIPPVGLSIWPDQIIISSFAKDWFNLVIKNQGLRDAYLDYFDALWKIAKK